MSEQITKSIKKRKPRSLYGPTEMIMCNLCNRKQQRKSLPAHFRAAHKGYLKQEGKPKNWDLLCKPSNDEIIEKDVVKIERAYDTGELEVQRGPLLDCRFALSTRQKKNSKKFQTQSGLVELRHARKWPIYKKWVRLASSRQSANHTDETRERAQNFLLYSSALEAAEKMKKLLGDCVYCMEEMKEEDDLMGFYVMSGDENKMVVPCSVLHTIHGGCYEKGVNAGHRMDSCVYGCDRDRDRESTTGMYL